MRGVGAMRRTSVQGGVGCPKKERGREGVDALRRGGVYGGLVPCGEGESGGCCCLEKGRPGGFDSLRRREVRGSLVPLVW